MLNRVPSFVVFVVALGFSADSLAEDVFPQTVFGPLSWIEKCPVSPDAAVRGPDKCARSGGGFTAKRSSGRHFALDLESRSKRVYQAKSIAAGTVAVAQKWPKMGNLVVVNHGDGRFSLYGHLEVISVKKDAKVIAGQLLGTLGYSGNAKCLEEKSIPPHLHFAVFRSVTSDKAPSARPLTKWKQEGAAMPSVHSGTVGPQDPTKRLQELGCFKK